MEEKDDIGFEIRLIKNLIEEVIRRQQMEVGPGVTQLQHGILIYLEKHQDCTVCQRDLEKAFRVSRATISQTLQTMERNGLIERSTAERDGRLKHLRLTAKAEEFCRKCKERIDWLEALMRSGMTEEETAAFIGRLRQIRHNLEHAVQRSE